VSEYQYYEFQALDRPLTESEQAYIRSLSRRVSLTPTHAIFTYQYGNFPGDPKRILEKYFDAMLYIADWGTKQLMFRLPRSVTDVSRADPDSDPNSPQFAQTPNSQLFLKLDRYGYFVVYCKVALTIL